MPYQFYHHAHKMQCDHGQIFFFFVSDTDPHRVTLSECEYGSPRCAIVLYCVDPTPPSHLTHAACYTPINALSSVAVVMIGNSILARVQTQIGRLVSVGRPNQNHQWVSHREHRIR